MTTARAMPAPSIMHLTPEMPAYRARILIVDDERNNRQLLEIMLSPEGHIILTADSGEEALAIVAEQPPDLILLDIMMPGMDGYQIVAAIKSDATTKHIPVILITALDDRGARMLGLNAGAEDFLAKPVDRAELCVRVRNLLRLKAYGDFYGRYSEILEREVVSRTAERTKTLDQHQATLRTNEERTNYALGSARMGVWELDMVTQRLTWSETMAPMFGLTREEAPTSAEAYFALIHPDDRGWWSTLSRRPRSSGPTTTSSTACCGPTAARIGCPAAAAWCGLRTTRRSVCSASARISPIRNLWRCSCGSRRRWKRSANWRAGSRTTSTIC